MNRIIVSLLVIAAVGATLIVASSQVGAQSLPMTNEHIQRIRDNCQAAERTLAQLRISDTQLRVNRTQLYIWISTKLMASMNGRLALNRLDASELISITADYDRTKDRFVSKFIEYDNQIASTTGIDCRERPVEFYEAVKKTRELRQQVHQLAQSMTSYTEQYGKEFESFRATFNQSRQGKNV